MSGESVRAWLERGTGQLRAAGIAEPLSDARRLLAAVLGVNPAMLLAHDDRRLDDDETAAFSQALSYRLARKPVARIAGFRSFWKHEFVITQDVLDPRPDTETLVEVALSAPFSRVLDLGTGSGCILLSLLAERADATGVGTDISAAALGVADRNAHRLGVTGRVRLEVADWFAGVEGRFDLIVCNPPYIAADEMAGLSPEVRLWDPVDALTPGGDGLAGYRAIAAGASAHLTALGRLIVEIGPTQAAAVAGLFAAAGLTEIAVYADIDGRDRVVTARAPEPQGLI